MKIRFIEAVSDVPSVDIKNEIEYVKKYMGTDVELSYEIVENVFPSIETETQAIVNGAQILKSVIKAEKDGVDGVFINCFDDPAVNAAREIAKIPVVGPYRTSVLFANTIGDNIAIISTDLYGTFAENKKAKLNSFGSLIKKIMYVDMGVLEFEEEILVERLLKKCLELEKEGIQVVILGCTGMAFIIEKLRERLLVENCKIQVVEPLVAGMLTLENIIRCEFTNSINEKLLNKEELINGIKKNLI